MTKYVKSLKFSTSGETYVIRDADAKSRLDTLEPVVEGKQDELVSTVNIKTINNQSILGSGNIEIGGSGGTTDYDQLSNRPQIAGTTLTGNKSLSDLGIAAAGDLSSHTSDANIHVTQTDKETWSGKQDKLIAGDNITIAEDGKTISATGGASIVTPAGEASVLDDSQPKNLFGTTTTQEEVETETVIVDRTATCAYEATAATNGPFFLGNQTAERGKQLASVSFYLKTKNPDSDTFTFYIANFGRDEITTASQISSYITNWRTTGYAPFFTVQVSSSDLNKVINFKLDGSDPKVTFRNPDFLDSEGYLVIPAQNFVCFGDPLNLTNFGYSRGSTHPEDPNIAEFWYLNDSNDPETHPSAFSKSNSNFGYNFYERTQATEEVTTQNFDEYLVTKEEETVTEYVNAAPTPTDYASTRAYQGGLYFISNCSHWNGKLLKAVSYCPRSGITGVFKVGYPSTGTNDFSASGSQTGVTISGIRTLFTINPGDDGYTEIGGYSDKLFKLDGTDPRVTIVATDLYDSEHGGFLWGQTMLLGGDDRANANSSAADKEAGTYAMAWFNAGVSTDYWCSHINMTNISGEEGNETASMNTHSSDSILIHMYTEETSTVVNETVHSDVIAQALADIEDLKEHGGGESDSPLKGKYLSIIGDSISTFSGWSNIAPGSTSAAIYYPKDWLNDVNQTYWKKLVDRTGMNLLVNNSWSGSECAGSASSSSCVVSQTNNRCHQLHKNGINPDYILINIGTNDFDHDFELGVWNGRGEKFPDNPETTSPSTFREAYAVMLYRLRIYYPLARVFCCTIPCGNNEGDGFNEINGKGYSLAEWNDAIREVATAFGCKVIEMATAGMDYYTLSTLYGDGRLHPSEAGMERMYEIIRAYMENNISSNATAIRRSTYVATNQGTANAGKIMAVGSDGKVAATTAAYVSNNQGSGNAGKVLGIDSTGAVVPVTSGGGGTIVTPAGIASVFDDSQPKNLFEVTPGQDVEYFQTDVITPEMSSTHRGPAAGIYYPAGTCYNDICGKYISAVKFLVYTVVANAPWEVYIRDWQTDDLHSIENNSTPPATSDVLLFKVQPVAADLGNYVTFALDGSDPRITDINQDYVVDGMIHIPAQHYMGLHATSESGTNASHYGYTQSGSTVATPQTFVYVSSNVVKTNQGTLFYDVSYQTAAHASETQYAFDKYLVSDKPVYEPELAIQVIPTSGTMASARGGIYFWNYDTHAVLNGNTFSGVEYFGREGKVLEIVKATVENNLADVTGLANDDLVGMYTTTGYVPEQYVLCRITPTSTDTTTPTFYKFDGSDSRVEIVNTALYDNEKHGFPIDSTMMIGFSDRQNPVETSGNTTSSFFYQTVVTGGSKGFYGTNTDGTFSSGGYNPGTTSTSSLNLNPYIAVATGETVKVWNSDIISKHLSADDLFGETSTTTEALVDAGVAIADNSSLGSTSVAIGPFYWDDQTSIQNQYLYSIRMKFLSKGTGAMPVYAANWGGTGTITVSGSTINSVTIDWTKWSDDTTYNIPLFKITPDTSDVGNIVEFKLDGTDPRVTDINPDFVRNGYIYIPEGWYVGVGDHSYNKTSGQVSATGTFGHGGSSSISGHKFYYSNSDSSQEPTTVPSGFQSAGVWLGVQWRAGILGQETVTTYNFDNYLATKEEVKTSELAANLIGNNTYDASAIKGIYMFNSNTHAALNDKVLTGVSLYPRSGYTVEFVKATVTSNSPMTTGSNADIAAMRAGTDIPSQYVLFRITGTDLEVGKPTYFALDGSDPRVEIVDTDAYDAEQGGFPWNSTMALGVSDWHNPEASVTTNNTSCFMFKSTGVSSSEARSGFHSTTNSGISSIATTSGSLFVNMYTATTEVQTTIHSDIIKGLIEKEVGSPLKGKTISFVGDSITTFSGITNVDPLPTNAAVWYPHNSITSVDQTYWRKLVDRTGMNLLVNNAWSGSHVTNRGRGDICNYDYQADSGSGTSTNKDRCTHLHATQNGTTLNPDYIVINMGTNDFDNMSTTYPFGTWNGRGEDFPECSAKPTNFREAYAVMLRRITTAYPLAKVYCCTVPCGNVKGGGLNEKNAVGVYLVEFNDAIREIATAYGCRVIELATSGLNYNTLSTLYEDSNLHPNEAGMERYYEIIRAALEDDDSTNVSCPRYSSLMQGTAPTINNSTAADLATLVTDFNSLLAALRDRGVIVGS